MKNTLPLLFTLLLLFPASLVLAENGPATLELGGPTQPKVNFSHGAHQALAGNCENCHHMGVGNGGCKGCHGRDGRFADATTAIHASCNGCHAERAVAGSDACGFCHIAATGAAKTAPETGGSMYRNRR